jgi:hypothetical protein
MAGVVVQRPGEELRLPGDIIHAMFPRFALSIRNLPRGRAAVAGDVTYSTSLDG